MNRGNTLSTLLIIVNVAVFIWMLVTFGTTEDTKVLMEVGAMYGKQAELKDFLTANFIHIGFIHLISNMVSIWIFGPLVEAILGWWRFLLIYFVSGLAGTVAVYFFNPDIVTAGASTCIFGLMGALTVLVLKYPHQLGNMFVYVLAMTGYNLYNTFTNPGISIPGHIGGLIAGVILAILLSWGKEIRQD